MWKLWFHLREISISQFYFRYSAFLSHDGFCRSMFIPWDLEKRGPEVLYCTQFSFFKALGSPVSCPERLSRSCHQASSSPPQSTSLLTLHILSTAFAPIRYDGVAMVSTSKIKSQPEKQRNKPRTKNTKTKEQEMTVRD